jgi:hypothetical protein
MNPKRLLITSARFVLFQIIFFIFLLKTNVGYNFWSLLTRQGCFIPIESFILTFKEKIAYSGSGEWWIYGEDHNNYYYTGNGIAPYLYVVAQKSNEPTCLAFNKTDYTTWCQIERSLCLQSN